MSRKPGFDASSHTQVAYADFAEIRRGILQASGNVDLQRLSSYFPEGTLDLEVGRASLSKQALYTVVRELRAAGLKIETVDDEVSKLPKYVRAEPPATSFSLYDKPTLSYSGKLTWKLFSFFHRNFYTCPCFREGTADRLLLREQGVLGAVDEQGRVRGLWVATGVEGGLQRAPMNETLIKAHMQSHPAVFHYIQHRDFVAIFRNSVWLPNIHYQLLFEKLAVRRPERGEDRWFIRAEDLDCMRQIIGSLGLSLNEGEPPQVEKAKTLGAAETAAELIRLCYSHYLRSRKEEKFNEFAKIAMNRDWGAISDRGLQSKLTRLSNAAYNWERPAVDLMEYVGDRLTVDIHWSERRSLGFPTEIEGTAIDVDTTGYHSGMPFFKVVLPEFEMMLGLLTARLGTEHEKIRLPIYWLADKWRIIPYAGRLIFPQGPHTTVLRQKGARRVALEHAFSRIYGIPTMEDCLVRGLYLSAFFLDHDERLWKGCPEFSRYFTGYGRIVEKETGEFEHPTALAEDVFGNPFYLAYGEANYIRRWDMINWMRVNCPKRFFAHSCLIQQLRMGLSIPYFTLLEGTSPRDVGWDEVLSGTYLALLRYFQERTEEQLYSGVEHIRQPKERKQRALEEILLQSRALKHHGKLYYLYEFMNPDDLRTIIDKGALPGHIQFVYNSMIRFRPMVHPFKFGKSILADSYYEEELSQKYFPGAARHPIIISSDDTQYWVGQVVAALKHWGIVVLSIHPWKQRVASEIILKVREALGNYSVKIDREDVSVNYRGSQITETHFRMSAETYLMVRELRKNPSFRISI